MNEQDRIEQRLQGAFSHIASDVTHAVATAGDAVVAGSGTSDATRSRKPVLAAAAAAAVLMTAVGLPQLLDTPAQTTTTASPTAADATSAAAPTSRTTTTARSLSVSDDDVTLVAERLARLHGKPGYATVEAHYPTKSVLVRWHGAPPSEVADVANESPLGVRVAVIPAKYADTDLSAPAVRLLTLPRHRLNGAHITAVAPNRDYSGLTVDIVKPWNGDSDVLERVAGVPITVQRVDEPVQTLTNP